jgi:carbamoyl-phosphate synthase large subunit
MRILVTGANAPGASGTAWSLLQPDLFDEKVNLIGGDANTSYVNRYFEKVVTLPHGTDKDYITDLDKVCAAEKINLVIPQTTAETSALSKSRHQLRAKVALLHSKNNEVALTSKIDVYKVISRLKSSKLDFAICKNFQDVTDFQSGIGEDYFLKADSLSGGRGIVKLVNDISKELLNKSSSFHVVNRNQAELVFKTLNNGRGVIAQRASSGIEYSIDCYRDDEISIYIPRRRDVVRSGISQQTTVLNDDSLIGLASEFATDLGLIGVFGLQCIVDSDQEITFLECNPRIQGTMVASTLAGENLIGRAARHALGLTQRPANSIRWGAEYRRSWSGVGIVGEQSYEI